MRDFSSSTFSNMKKYILFYPVLWGFVFLGFSPLCVKAQNVGINNTGATANSSAILDVSSTSKGQLLPRMTTAQRDAIASPATGLIIYNTDNDCIQFWAQNMWTSISCANCVPQINTHPADVTACESSNLSFAVVANGSGLNYQWQEDQGSGFSNLSNGGVYSNVTSATMNITNVTTGMSTYKYRCVVSGTCSPSSTSNSAVLTVNTSPSISSHPSNASILVGANTTFSVTASGSGLTYQWQENDGGGFVNITNGGTNPAYSGATTSSLSLTNVPIGHNTYQYRCVVSGTCAPSATSNAATLTVNNCPTWSDDFSANNWTSTDSKFAIDIAADNEMDFDAVLDNTNDAIGIDPLGTNVSDSQWILRFKLEVTGFDASGASNQRMAVRIDSHDQSTGSSSAVHDAIGIRLDCKAGGNSIQAFYSDNANVEVGTQTATFDQLIVVGTFWVEIERCSQTSATVSLYSDATYTSLIEAETLNPTSDVNTMRYIVVSNRDNRSSSADIQGHIDDIELCNENCPWP